MSETKSTTNYGMFILRDDNRHEGVKEAHVLRIMNSIRTNNLLALRPIDVNGEMEVIDGQHRLEAAKRLSLPIYYKMSTELKAQDIALINANVKPWSKMDYLNFYTKQGYPEYQKLSAFIKKSGLTLERIFSITANQKTRTHGDAFRDGKFEFQEELITPYLDFFIQTIDCVHQQKGNGMFMKNSKVFRALIWLKQQPEFDEPKWFFNLSRFAHKLFPRTNINDYKIQFVSIYNWRNSNKIVIENKDELEEEVA